MHRLSGEALLSDALVARAAKALGHRGSARAPAFRARLVRILDQGLGKDHVERPLSEAQAQRLAASLLKASVAQALRSAVPPAPSSGYAYAARPLADLDHEIVAMERVDVNSADARALARLPRVGAALAKRIVKARRDGPYLSLADLASRVRGVGAVTTAALVSAVSFDAPADVVGRRYAPTGRLDEDLRRLVLLAGRAGPREGALAALDLVLTAVSRAPPAPGSRRRPLSRLARAKGPRHDARAVGVLSGSQYWYRLPGLLDAAEAEVDVCMFHAAAAEAKHPTRKLLDALVRAHERGVRVRVLFDADRPTDRYLSSTVNAPAREHLRSRGVDVRVDRMDRLLHSKWLRVDGSLVVLGSHNWSAGSYFHHDDVTLVVRSTGLAAQMRDRFQAAWEEGE